MPTKSAPKRASPKRAPSRKAPRSLKQERRERESALRRDDILAAASQAFADRGFQGTQVAEIANSAEVSLNSVYTLFKGKEELYEAVISRAAETVGDRVKSHVRDIVDPAERLLCVVDELFACFDEHRHLMRIYANTTHGLPWRVRQSMGKKSLQVFQDFTIWLIERTHEVKRAGGLDDIDAETFALSLIGTVTTVATRWIEDPSEQPLTLAAPQVRRLFAPLLARSNQDRSVP